MVLALTVLRSDDAGYGCFATVTTSLTSFDWRAHYAREFADHGWGEDDIRGNRGRHCRAQPVQRDC